jgi:hypothetical protein
VESVSTYEEGVLGANSVDLPAIGYYDRDIEQRIRTDEGRVFGCVQKKSGFKELNLVPSVSHPFKKGAMVG